MKYKDAKKTKDFLLFYVEEYAKRGEKIENFIERTPALQRPINARIVGLFAIMFLLLFPLIMTVPRNLSTEEFLYDAISVYIPILMSIALFFVNQKWLIQRVFLKRRLAPYIVVNFILILLLVLLRDLLLMAFDTILSPEGETYFIGWTSFRSQKIGFFRLIIFAVMNMGLCFANLSLFSIGAQMQYFYRKYLKKEATLQAELSFLKMQINQHFLFNTMNNIIAMMDIDSMRAKKLMLSLSQILRTMLYETKENYITVQKEVDILKSYAEIGKSHFGDNLDYQADFQLQNPEAKISPLILLPLVENVFKHGFNCCGRSFVRISVKESDGVLTYSSKNSNFPRSTKRDDHHGVGLVNMKKRLESVYEGRYSYEFGIEGDIYKVKLTIRL